jgi:hypothetical protein
METKKLVQLLRSKQPEAFPPGVSDPAAAELLEAAFRLLSQRLRKADEGLFEVAGLGTFRIRQVQREKDGAKVTRRIVTLKSGRRAPPAPSGAGGDRA